MAEPPLPHVVDQFANTLGTSAATQPTVTRHPKLADQVVELLRRFIADQGLKAGDRLPSEREIGLQFGVSRTVVREAVRSLVGKGLIEVQNGAGLRVAAIDGGTVSETLSLYLQGRPMEAHELHEVRILLEVETAGLAAERASEEDTSQMLATCEAMERAVAEDDPERAVQLDLAFHLAIAKSTGNELFPVLLDSIGEAGLEFGRRNLESGAGPRAVIMHETILAHIRSHDRDRAREAMAAHIEESFKHHEGAVGRESTPAP